MALLRTLSNSSGVVLSIRLLTLRISDVFCVLTPSQVRSFSQSRCQQQLSHHTIFPPPMGPFNKWIPIRSSAGQNNTGTQTFIQLWSRTCEGRKKNIPLIPLDFSYIAVLPNIPDFWKRKIKAGYYPECMELQLSFETAFRSSISGAPFRTQPWIGH